MGRIVFSSRGPHGKVWSRADYNASVREFDRLAPLIQDAEARTRLGVDMPRKRNAPITEQDVSAHKNVNGYWVLSTIGPDGYRVQNVYGGYTKRQAMREFLAAVNAGKKRTNAPLKGARAIGANMTEVEHGDLTVLYSYETPVAFLSPKGGYVTEKKWSVTTSKHIAKFFDRHGYDRKGAFKVPQDDIELFVRHGKLKVREDTTGGIVTRSPGRYEIGGNPAGQLWYPGGVAIGRYKMGEAGTRYYVIPVESTIGWDFPTLVHMFPDNLRPDGLALLEARLGYEHSGQQGYHLFKVRVGGKWSRPMRLRTALTEIPGVK